jgi:hypothetical protein
MRISRWEWDGNGNEVVGMGIKKEAYNFKITFFNT